MTVPCFYSLLIPTPLYGTTATAAAQQQKPTAAPTTDRPPPRPTTTDSNHRQRTTRQRTTRRQQQRQQQQPTATAAATAGVFGALGRDPTVCWPLDCCLCQTRLSLAAKLFGLACQSFRFHNTRPAMELGLGRRTRATTAREGSSCGKCNFLDRATCRLCGKQRQEKDTAIAGESDEPLLGTQPAPKRMPTFQTSTTGGPSLLKEAEAALVAAQEAGLPQNFIDELAQEESAKLTTRTRAAKTNW